MEPAEEGQLLTLTLTMEMEEKLRLEYKQLVDQLYQLSQLNVYSIEESRFLFPDINLQVCQIVKRMNQISKELEYLTGVKTRTVVEDIILG